MQLLHNDMRDGLITYTDDELQVARQHHIRACCSS